jgi:hypothetical protein
LFILRLNGAAAAGFYGFLYNGTYSFYQHGLDPQYSKLSVGQVLLGVSIERAIEEGAAQYDFLSGDDGYKDLWARESRPLMRIEACPPGWPALVRHGGESLRLSTRKLRQSLGLTSVHPVESLAQGHHEGETIASAEPGLTPAGKGM